MPKQRKVTETLFNEVKVLLKQGRTYRSIGALCGISFNTVEMIAKAKDYGSYFDLISQIGADKRAKKGEKNMPKGVYITEEDFDQIKSLTTKKIPVTKIAELLGYSRNTVSLINCSLDYTEYKEKIQRTNDVPSIDLSVFQYHMDRIYSEIAEQTMLMKKLVEIWEGSNNER